MIQLFTSILALFSSESYQEISLALFYIGYILIYWLYWHHFIFRDLEISYFQNRFGVANAIVDSSSIYDFIYSFNFFTEYYHLKMHGKLRHENITWTEVMTVGPTKFPFSYPGTLSFLPSRSILAPSLIPDSISSHIRSFD